MKTLIQVLTQHFEEGRPKGGQIFQFRADSDIFMYDEELAIKAIKKMIASKTLGWYGTYEYVSHELIFHEPVILDDNAFDFYYNELAKE